MKEIFPINANATFFERYSLPAFLILTPLLSLAIPLFIPLPTEIIPLTKVFVPALLAILLTALIIRSKRCGCAAEETLLMEGCFQTVCDYAGAGAALKFLIAGDGASLLIWFSAALLIPSLALALGIWSKSSKLFEVLHVSIWYLALNGIDMVDYFGANSDGNIGVFIPLSISLIFIAFVGRKRQLQN